MVTIANSFIVEDSMHNKKRTFYWLFLGMIIIAGLIFLLCPQEKPLPKRGFSTSQLLLSPLPGWGIYSGPEDHPLVEFNLYKAVAGSEIRFMKAPLGIGQWSRADVENGNWEQVADMTQSVVKFPTIGYARQAYSARYKLINSLDPQKYFPPEYFEYQSPIADQFRILCDSDLPRRGGISGFLDAQYEEFDVMIQYGGSYLDNKDNYINDLKTIAISIDAQMEKYLGSHK